MRNKLFLGAAVVAMIAPSAAYAQSTGTIDAENKEIVVTGTRGDGTVGGTKTPDSPKTKQVLGQQIISTQQPGQSILDTINLVPGVSFQNNDPFGSAGGTLTIRGFDASRISLTLDGAPLNDTGNYAIYSNQQIDPELIDQVNVNLGTTDIDSPTASASGSTVNYRLRNPTDDFHARMLGSIGDYNFYRIFGVVDTGVFTPFGTKMWLSGSHAENNNVFNNYGKIEKNAFNFKVYQPIGSNGDFVAVSGNYNQNRNNFFGSVPLRNDTTILGNNGVSSGTRVVGTAATNRFPTNSDEAYYRIARCTVPAARVGVIDLTNGCGTLYDYRTNPSNTGTIRLNSRFTLADGLVLTIDPSFSYTKANGGGTTNAFERAFSPTIGAGTISGTTYAGRDLNGDGDLLDTVTISRPSQTVTHRYIVLSSLRYDFDDNNTLRVGYTHDYGRHRQTGEAGYLANDGSPLSLFPIDGPIIASSGYPIEGRDRLSFAILDQVYGEYRGQFFDDRATLNVGLTGKFFKRDLNNFCFTNSTSAVSCFGRDNTAQNAVYAAANPTVQGPQERVFKYNRALPNVGASFKVTPAISVNANYSKGLQVPGTDNLYQSFFYATTNADARPAPETTDNFDVSARYTTGKIQAILAPFYTRFQNRLASAYDPDLNATIYRNLGRVNKYGIDGSIMYQPVRAISLYAFGEYLKSKIQDNLQTGTCTAANVTAGLSTGVGTCTTAGQAIYALTAGKRESGSPVYSYGGRIAGNYGPIEIAVQAKRTGRRYVNDQNLPVTQSYTNVVGATSTTVNYQVYGAFAPGYTTVDIFAKLSLEWAGLNKQTFLQFNLSNALNQFYVGGFGGTTANSSVTFVQIGSPRAFSASINMAF